MVTIATLNNKGGCAKTTTALNTGAALRLKGFNVLLVDIDGQANLTACTRATAEGGTAYDIFTTGETVRPYRFLDRDEKAGVLDIIPGAAPLSFLDMTIGNKPDAADYLRTALEKFADRYDVAIIDTPPALGVAALNALNAADFVVITSIAEYLAICGIKRIIDLIGTAKGWAVLFTLYDRRKKSHRTTAEGWSAAGFPAFETRIRPNVDLADATAAGQAIQDYAPNCNGAQDYAAFADELQARLKLKARKRK